MDGALLAVAGTILGTTIGALYSLRSARLAAHATMDASRTQAVASAETAERTTGVQLEIAERTTGVQLEIVERQLRAQRDTQIHFFHLQRRVEIYAKAGAHVEIWVRWVRATFVYNEALGNYLYKEEKFPIGTADPPSIAMDVDIEAMFKLYASPELWTSADDLRRIFAAIVQFWQSSNPELLVGSALEAMEDHRAKFVAYAQRDLNPNDSPHPFDIDSMSAMWRTRNIEHPGVNLP